MNVRRMIAAILTSVLFLNGIGLSAAGAAEQVTDCGEAPAGMNVIVSNARRIVGTSGDDFICAGPGDNIIRARGGNDIVFGGAGRDRINGGSGDDVIFGGDDKDRIKGRRGNDTLHGEAGNDRLFGNTGNDVLEGGEGRDKARGGGGDDVCSDIERARSCEETQVEAKSGSFEESSAAEPTNQAPKLTLDADGYSIDENSTAGTALDNDEISAIDPDGDSLIFSISGGSGEAFFSIHPEDGTITVQQSEAVLDHEMTDSYTLVVEVTDGELVDVATIVVTINDVNEAPVLTADSDDYSIDENSDGGTELDGDELTAVDPDAGSKVSFFIAGGSGEGLFVIDTSSGVLTVMESEATIDYEVSESYTLIVAATDGELTHDVTITIEVNDVDDTPDSDDDDDDDDDDLNDFS